MASVAGRKVTTRRIRGRCPAASRIQQLGPRLAAGQRPRIRRVVTFRPATDAMEMTVVVDFGPRVHALALRLERGNPDGRWLCTTVEAA